MFGRLMGAALLGTGEARPSVGLGRCSLALPDRAKLGSGSAPGVCEVMGCCWGCGLGCGCLAKPGVRGLRGMGWCRGFWKTGWRFPAAHRGRSKQVHGTNI